MAPKQYVEKPRKVMAEQFMDADILGVHRCGLSPLVETGPPHVHVGAEVYMLNATDWILSDKWTGQPTGVLTDEQFQDAFGNPGGGNPLPVDG